MFHPFDADAILQVPLSRRVVQDVVVWFGSKKGNYAVKSGYYVAKQLRMEESNLGESSRQGMNGAFWSRIWQANVPNKIKKISWRACMNILPTQANLARRRVVEEAWCSSCQLQDESVLHVLWGCGAAQDVWIGSLSRLQKSSIVQTDFLQLVTSLMPRLSRKEWDLFWDTCWQIWNQRNTAMHGGVFQHPSRSSQRALEYLSEFTEAQD